MENIACRIVVHVAQFTDVPVKRGYIQLIRTQDSTRLVERPGEVVAIVVEIDVGILRGEKAAPLAVCHYGIEPCDDLARRLPEIFADKALEAVGVIAQQLRVVVQHLLEMRHHPALIDTVAMESARNLVIDSATRHLFERDAKGFTGRDVATIECQLQEQIECCWMGEFWLRTETPIAWIELGDCRICKLVDKDKRQFAATAGEALIVLDSCHDTCGGFEGLIAPFMPDLCQIGKA